MKVELENLLDTRRATLSDLALVTSWISTPDECERWAGVQVSFPIDLQALPIQIGYSEQNAYVMVADRTLVAFGQIIDKLHGRQHLAKFIVSPMHRRCGYGRIFLRKLLQRATADRLSLNVQQYNSPAIALYVAVGFAPTERPVEQGASPRSIYMEWKRALAPGRER